MWWAAGLGGLLAAVAVLYFALRASRARREADAQRARAVKAENALAACKDEGHRQESAIRVLRAEREAAVNRAKELARSNPALSREYLRGVLLDASGGGSEDPRPGAPAGNGAENDSRGRG